MYLFFLSTNLLQHTRVIITVYEGSQYMNASERISSAFPRTPIQTSENKADG